MNLTKQHHNHIFHIQPSKMFKVLLTNLNATFPKRADIGAAGYDLSSVDKVCIEPGTQAIVDTGLVLEFPSDCYVRVAPRSGLAAKHAIDVMAGVIDSTYRGNVKVILHNHGTESFMVNVGDRIAQMIFEKIYTPDLQQVQEMTELTTSDRGQGGFGSTGVN